MRSFTSTLLVLLLLAGLQAGCGGKAATKPPSALAPSPTVVSPPVEGLVTKLEDESHDLPGGQIEWTTYWKLCWARYPGASEYELQPMTGEGAGKRTLRQAGTCLQIEVAKGKNAKARGLFNRDLMLASLAGQMNYRVRAVLGESRVSQWSAIAIVGQDVNPNSAFPSKSKSK